MVSWISFPAPRRRAVNSRWKCSVGVRDLRVAQVQRDGPGAGVRVKLRIRGTLAAADDHVAEKRHRYSGRSRTLPRSLLQLQCDLLTSRGNRQRRRLSASTDPSMSGNGTYSTDVSSPCTLLEARGAGLSAARLPFRSALGTPDGSEGVDGVDAVTNREVLVPSHVLPGGGEPRALTRIAGCSLSGGAEVLLRHRGAARLHQRGATRHHERRGQEACRSQPCPGCRRRTAEPEPLGPTSWHVVQGRRTWLDHATRQPRRVSSITRDNQRNPR